MRRLLAIGIARRSLRRHRARRYYAGQECGSEDAAKVAVMISCIRGLGEIALRVQDLDRMQSFYEQVVGLQLMKRFPGSAFFRIAEGVGGHIQILALFDRGDKGPTKGDKPPSTLDHLAFAVVREDFADEKRRIEKLRVPMETAEHAWVQWRSFYVNDPEGNKVEWVCYDASVAD